MAGFTGMDVQAVRTLAQQMDQASDQINQLASQLNGKLNSVDWKGNDRNHFVNDWQGHHMNQLRQVSNALKDAASKARQNAAEQERTSNT